MRGSVVLLLLVAVCCTCAGSQIYNACVKKSANRKFRIVSPIPSDYLSPKDVPTSWDWRNVNGKSYVTVSRNQHLPQYCASCWAFATTSALGDRIRIATNADFPEYELAPQVLVDCVDGSSCHGGDPAEAYEYIRIHGVPDETCAPYLAVDQECTPENVCKTCDHDLDDPTAKCSAQKSYPLYYVSEHGTVTGEANMKAEIYARGPISCTIAVTTELVTYTGGIFNDTTGNLDLDHEISVVGWGVERGAPYWIVRNSWGTYWGEKGWFRLARGTNNLGIESECYWATPKINQEML